MILGRGGYTTLDTFKSCPFYAFPWGFSIALYSQYLTPKYSTTLEKYLILSSLTPSSAKQFFDSFLLLESIRGALILPVEVFDSARTMQRPAEHFINQEQRGNCSRI